MTPLARIELERYNRIRKEAKKRDRDFAPKSVDTGFAVGVGLGLAAFVLIYLAWRLT